MVHRLPNPIRLFSELRDEFFIDVLEQLEVPMNLFSDIRDSQLPQLMYIVEAAQVKEKRGQEKADGKSVFDQMSLSAFVPRFILYQGLLRLLTEDKVSEIVEKFRSSEHVKAMDDLKRTAKDWLNEIPEEKLEQSYFHIVDMLFEVFLGPITGESVQDAIMEKLKELDSSFANTVETYLDLEVYASLKDNTWLKGERGEKLIPLKGQELKEGEKPKTRPLTRSQFRGIVNYLYSLFLELAKFIENPVLPKKIKKEGEDSESSEEEEVVFELDESTTQAVERMVYALLLDMLLYQPYPDKQRYPVVSFYLRKLGQFVKGVPDSFWDLLIQTYQMFSHGIAIQTPPYRAMENSYRRLASSFWNSIIQSLMDNKLESQRIVAAHWIQILVSKTILDQLAQDPREVDPLKRTLSRLENLYWTYGRRFLESEMTTSFHLWSNVAYISTIDLRNAKAAYSTYLMLEPLVSLCEADGEKFDASHADLMNLYKRMVTIGLQSNSIEIKEKMTVVVEKYEKTLTVLKEEDPEFPDLEFEERFFASLKDAVNSMEIVEEEEPRRRRRARR